MKTHLPLLALAVTCTLAACADDLDPRQWIGHDRTRPLPRVVEPGSASTQDQPGKAPADAIVLFDGTSIAPWVAMNGEPTRWIVKDGAMECVPGSGYIRTLQCFGDAQVHVEFATPAQAEGSSQGRGNSGFFLGMTRYEIQILDSYNNPTYADGSCASVYNQYPPLVNASRPPGQWQSYDLVWTAPRFTPDGALQSPARLTLLHNGVLVHHNAELIGNTGWVTRGPYHPHPEKLPLCIQDHGNPVRFRNIWVRELGRPGRPEYYLADATLDRYTGKYEVNKDWIVEITRRDGNLFFQWYGEDFLVFATSPNRFFAKTTDVQVEFKTEGNVPVAYFSIGEDGGMRAIKVK
ncbi:MAG TPA: DUF1080 domain-containing protein [Verrucomicrobiota bacterium]|nr:DUF1080 domain-containing protein [Verrucomicrobiota bacterium]HNU51425.1 DUF1080 domain-containing protein [Verrucomicrobiota bacterium]